MGDLLFHDLQHDAAIPLLRAYCAETKSKTQRCLLGYRLAFCLARRGAEGDAEEAARMCSKVVEWARPSQNFEEYAKRKCQQVRAAGGGGVRRKGRGRETGSGRARGDGMRPELPSFTS